jgi:hypothetical protein
MLPQLNECFELGDSLVTPVPLGVAIITRYVFAKALTMSVAALLLVETLGYRFVTE